LIGTPDAANRSMDTKIERKRRPIRKSKRLEIVEKKTYYLP
jgi:hypothetical protein